MVVEFNILHLILVFIVVFLIYRWLLKGVQNSIEKVYLTSIFGGLYFYGGIGASLDSVNINYTIYFISFLLIFVFSYKKQSLFSKFKKNNLASTNFTANPITLLTKDNLYKGILLIYIILQFINLIYPNIKLINLINPPSPDGLGALEDSISGGPISFISKILFYIELFLTPFFYFCLIYFKNKPIKLFSIIALVLYVKYCSAGYMGRGLILMNMALWLFVTYYFNKNYRKLLIISTTIFIPFILSFFYIYSIKRLGYDVNFDASSNIIKMLFIQEVNFPENFETILNSTKRVDITQFFVWILTLPIPKLLIGSQNVPVLNFEISEILLNTSRNAPSFWVKLSGFVTESIYIFGPAFFWIGAYFIGRIIKWIFILLSIIKDSEVLIIYFGIYWGFMYSRAGMGAILPFFFNAMLLFYIVVILKIDKRIPNKTYIQ